MEQPIIPFNPPPEKLSKDDIQRIVNDALDERETANQFGVSKIPYHTHNGVDSPQINLETNSTVTPLGDQGWQYDGIFSPTSNTKVSWTAGTLTFTGGDSFHISLGNTGTMSGLTYVYFDESVSKTDFQVASNSTLTNTLTDNNFFIGFLPNGNYIFTAATSAPSGGQKFDTNFTSKARSAVSTLYNLAFSPDSDYIFGADSSNLYKMSSVDFTVSLSVAKSVGGSISRVFISPDGVYLYVLDNTNSKLYKYYTVDLTEVTTSVNTGVQPNQLVVSPDGSNVYVVSSGGGLGGLQKFTASNLALVTTVNTAGGNAFCIAMATDGTYLLTGSIGNLEKFNTALTQLLDVSAGMSQPYAISISPSGTFAYVVGSSAAKLIKFNTSDLTQVANVDTNGNGSTAPTFCAASPDGNYVYVIYFNAVRKFNSSDLSLVAIPTGTIVREDSIIVAVAQNVAATKNAIFDVFGGNALGGLEKLVTSADLDGTVGTITSGTWNGNVIAPPYGGTGIANNSAMTVTGSGNFAYTRTLTNTTNVTFPTTGTLATLAGAESLTNKKLGSLTSNGFVKTSASDGTLSVDTYTYGKVVASTFEKAETGTDANVLTYATGGSDEFLIVQVATDVSALTGTSVAITVTWKDSNNTTATSTLTLSATGDGTINIPINSKASQNVVVSTVFVGVSTAYNISAFITKLN